MNLTYILFGIILTLSVLQLLFIGVLKVMDYISERREKNED
jgi:hypothetical protein